MMMNIDHLSGNQIQELIYHLASGLAAETGEDFFFSLLGHLSRALAADFAMVGELLPNEAGQVATLAVLADGERAGNFLYDLRGTPCEQVVGRDACVFPHDVCQTFPEDHLLVEMGVEGYAGRPLIDSQGHPLGLLVLLFRKPVPDPQLTEQLLRIFAIRASSEMERLRYDRVLAKREEHFRLIYEHSPLAYHSLDRDGRLLEVNPAWEQLFGYPREQVVGQPFSRFVALPAGVAPGSNFARLKETGKIDDVELEVVCVGGEHRLTLLSGRVDYDLHGVFERSHCVLHDMTERARQQQQILRANQLAALGELAAGVAHEINNPVSGVINYAELLRSRMAPECRELELVERIIREGDRIAAIVGKMLSLAREPVAEMVLVDLVDVLASTLYFVAGHLHRDGIELDVDLEEELPPVLGQEQQLQQLFLNLLSNARYALNRRYPGPDPEKRVRVSLAGAQAQDQLVLRLTVRDLGTGIPADLLPKVMQPFVTSKPSSEGTGLGLSICHEIVSRHGGTIWIDSREGAFTEVTVDLLAAPIHRRITDDTTHIGG
jgi:PAS domain S-box-containing protein